MKSRFYKIDFWVFFPIHWSEMVRLLLLLFPFPFAHLFICEVFVRATALTEASSGREILVSLSFSEVDCRVGFFILHFPSQGGCSDITVQTEDIIFKLTSNLNWFFAFYVD